MREIPQELIELLIRAWNDAGPVPRYHLESKRTLQNSWPTLHAAIDRIVAEADRA